MFLIDRLASKLKLPTADAALPGRPNPLPTAELHFVNGRPIADKTPQGMAEIYLGMGCFWGVERLFWEKTRGVGYSGWLSGGHDTEPDL